MVAPVMNCSQAPSPGIPIQPIPFGREDGGRVGRMPTHLVQAAGNQVEACFDFFRGVSRAVKPSEAVVRRHYSPSSVLRMVLVTGCRSFYCFYDAAVPNA